MFAGIIERVCFVRAVRPGPTASRLEIDLAELADDLPLGASVAINGVCLTLASLRGQVGEFDVVPETWRLTTLQTLRKGSSVNAERSLRVGDRIDGHFVQGHVDGVGEVERIEQVGGEHKLWIQPPADLAQYIVRKGSITLDGVSLTVVDVVAAAFSVALIPTTLDRTMLGRRRTGDRINIETDIIARVVVSRLSALAGDSPDVAPAGLTLDRLREGGFA